MRGEIPTNLRPIGGNVLVELLPGPAKTTGGLHIPEHLRDDKRLARCKVLAVGEGRLTRQGVVVPPAVEPGDEVLMSWRVNAHLGQVRVVPEGELLGVFC